MLVYRDGKITECDDDDSIICNDGEIVVTYCRVFSVSIGVHIGSRSNGYTLCNRYRIDNDCYGDQGDSMDYYYDLLTIELTKHYDGLIKFDPDVLDCLVKRIRSTYDKFTELCREMESEMAS